MTHVATASVIDQYIDSADGILYSHGLFLRIRNGSTLQLKYTPDQEDVSHTSSREVSYASPLVSRDLVLLSEEISSVSGLPIDTAVRIAIEQESLVWIRRTRQTFRCRRTLISLDDVEGLGSFIEIEAVGEDGHPSPSAIKDLREIVDILGIENLSVGYVELMLERVRPELYRRGRYIR